MFDNNPTGRTRWEHHVEFKMISDGLTKTFLAGEKHIPLGAADRQGSLYNGNNQNNCARVAGRVAPLANGDRDLTLCRETTSCRNMAAGPCICDIFGSSHPGVCQFVFADGHVAIIPASADLVVVDRLAARDDGLLVSTEY
jgi:prepilin-type processing-associated H-X9-DG protein